MKENNILFGWVNHVVTGTLSAGSQEPSLPVSHLQDAHGGTPWQTLGVQDSFRVDAGADVLWRAFGLFRTTLSATATVRWRLGATAGSGSEHDSGILPGGVKKGYGQHVYVAADFVEARHLTCDIVDTANPDGFLRVGHAYAGEGWQPERNYNRRDLRGRRSNNQSDESRGGQRFVINGAVHRRRNFTLPRLSEAESFEDLDEMLQVAAREENILVVPRPQGTWLQQEALFGTVASSGVEDKNPAFQSIRLSVTERL